MVQAELDDMAREGISVRPLRVVIDQHVTASTHTPFVRRDDDVVTKLRDVLTHPKQLLHRGIQASSLAALLLLAPLISVLGFTFSRIYLEIVSPVGHSRRPLLGVCHFFVK
jgi:hypothetical protein